MITPTIGRRVRDLAVVGTGDDLERLRIEGVEGALLGFGETTGAARCSQARPEFWACAARLCPPESARLA
jgi:hypothetical protein